MAFQWEDKCSRTTAVNHPNSVVWKVEQHMQQAKKGFTLIEILVAVTIVGILAAIGLGSFASSQMKARDSRRKSDLSAIAKALEFYYNDRGEYPDDDDSGTGAIKGCGTAATPANCTWGSTFAQGNATYMIKLPQDPGTGLKYYYVRVATNQYRLYTKLENTKDTVSIISPAQANTDCSQASGNQTCNYGVSSSNTTP